MQGFVWAKVFDSFGRIPRSMIANFLALLILILMGNGASGSELSAKKNSSLEFNLLFPAF